MRHRSFHGILAITAILLLVSLTVLIAKSPAGAALPSTHSIAHSATVHKFSPSGHSVALPRSLSTFTTPQVKGTAHNSMAPRSAPGGSKHVPNTRNVVRVPAPVNQDIATKASFKGISDTGWFPSDANGAGGIYNYFQTVNEQFSIYTLTGAVKYSNNFNTWFGQSGSLFDPKVVWDDFGKRFIFLADSGSSLLVSVAQQTNGLGNYCNYSFSTLSGYFADYPQLGVDRNGIYFSANLYGSPFTNEVFYANRGQMETCASTSFVFYTGLTNADGSGTSFAIVPAVEHTYPGNTEYMVNTNGPGGGCSVTLWWLNSDTSLFNFNVRTQCYSPPPPAAQHGSAGTLETLDNRLYEASFQNGLLSFDTAGSHDWGDGNGPVGIVVWFQINASSASLANQGAFGTPGYWLFFPAMQVNSIGHILFVYDSSGPTIYPSIWAISGCLCDTIAVAKGTSYYGTSGTSRWGDFQSAWRDPRSPKLIWVTGQYGAATNSWGTWAARLQPA